MNRLGSIVFGALLGAGAGWLGAHAGAEASWSTSDERRARFSGSSKPNRKVDDAAKGAAWGGAIAGAITGGLLAPTQPATAALPPSSTPPSTGS